MAADIRVHPPSEPERGPREDGEFSVRTDPALLAQGWTRRNLADPARAEETIELYRSLGFEVKVVQLTPADFGPSCDDCAPLVCRSYVLIYTRKPDDAADRARGGRREGESHGSDAMPA
ncbi:MAG: hypothetical protein GY715_01420 [Planctomycetes bacterium]|nr:hypothetical protein [Planctomycetota bacterium]